MSVVDLHDLATILLRERLLTEPRFKHDRLVEVNDGLRAFDLLPNAFPLPGMEELPSNSDRKAYLVMKDANALDDDPPVEPKDFLYEDIRSGFELSPKDTETAFWMCKHHDRGYLMAHAMQAIFDCLPSGTRVRLRTSQGHSITCDAGSITALNIIELATVPRLATYICQIKGLEERGPRIDAHTVGEDGWLKYVYLLFGDLDTPQENRVVLDLAAPMLGMRGLGGEPFVMEREDDFINRVLSRATVQHREIKQSSRIGVLIPNERNVPQSIEAQILAERVLSRLIRIQNGEESFCSYCGKDGTRLRCSICHDANYCDGDCQRKSWIYHRRWCQDRPLINGA